MTAEEMKCSRNTIYLAMNKKSECALDDKPHIPKTPHPKTASKELMDLVVKKRVSTGFGKTRLRWLIASTDNILIPESSIGKILKRNNLTRKKKRVRREYHRVKYQWDKILPFEEAEMDTKEIPDKGTLPKELYDHVTHSKFIPQYQWTFQEPVTRIRFLSWSYSPSWQCGQIFGKIVICWLRLFGFNNIINLWSDGGSEFSASSHGAFERTKKFFWKPLGVTRKIIRKGHPEDNPFVERSHQTDDYEFYIPHLLKIKSQLDFLKLAAWWQKIYNTVRPHMGINNLTPYQKIKSLGYTTPLSFCLFPTIILDTVTDQFSIKCVQNHRDYDLIWKYFLAIVIN